MLANNTIDMLEIVKIQENESLKLLDLSGGEYGVLNQNVQLNLAKFKVLTHLNISGLGLQ